MISKKVKGLSLGMAATCFWGGFYPVSRMLFGYDDGSVDPLNFTLIRFALATLFLSPLFLSKIQRQRAADMLRNDALMILSLGAIGILGEGLCVFWALKYTTSARASLLANASPITTLLISWMAGREYLTRNKVAGMIIGFLGILLAFSGQGKDRFVHDASTLAGDVLAFTSGICWSYFTVFGGDVAKKYGGLLCCEMMFIAGLIFLLPLTLVVNGGIQLNLSWQAWLGALYLGVLSYGLANSLWYMALYYVTPGELGSLGYVSALLTISLSIIFLDEQITATFCVAVVLVLIGVALMLKQKKPATT